LNSGAPLASLRCAGLFVSLTLAASTCKSANASFTAIIFNRNILVVGVDSRSIGADGRVVSDQRCKILALNDSTAFAALGYAVYTADETAPVINAWEVAQARASEPNLDVTAAARKFAGSLVLKLNKTPERTRPGDPIFLLGAFAGLGAKKPMLSSVVIYNLNSGFVYTSPTTHDAFNKIVTFGLDEAIALQITKEPAMRTLARGDMPNAERLPAMIELLIQRAIDRQVSPDVGGNPTVLVIERGQRPRWHRKASECPDQPSK
jgi:hypothetical protein